MLKNIQTYIIYIHIYTCAHVYTCTHAHARACTHTYTYTFAHTHSVCTFIFYVNIYNDILVSTVFQLSRHYQRGLCNRVNRSFKELFKCVTLLLQSFAFFLPFSCISYFFQFRSKPTLQIVAAGMRWYRSELQRNQFTVFP